MDPTPCAGPTRPPPPTYASLFAPGETPPPRPWGTPPLLRFPQVELALEAGNSLWVSGDVLVQQSRHWRRILADSGLEGEHGGGYRACAGLPLPPAIWWQVFACMHDQAHVAPCAQNAAGLLAAVAYLEPDPGEGGQRLRRLQHRVHDWLVDEAEVSQVMEACTHALALPTSPLLDVAAPWLARRLQHAALQKLSAPLLRRLMFSTAWLLQQRACQDFALQWLQAACPDLLRRPNFVAQAGLAEVFSAAHWHTAGLEAFAKVTGLCSPQQAAHLQARRQAHHQGPLLRTQALARPLQRVAHWPSRHGSTLALVRADDYLLSAGVDGTARLWRQTDGHCLHQFSGAAAPLLAAAWARSGTQVHACGSDGAVYSWPVPVAFAARAGTAHAPTKLFSNPSWEPPVPSAALGGAYAAFGQPDGSVRVCRLADAADPVDLENTAFAVRLLAGHRGPVGALAFAGNTLVSGAADATVRAWDAQHGTPLHSWYHPEARITALAATGDHVLSGDADGKLQLASLRDGGLVWRQDLFFEVKAVALAGATAVALAEGRLHAFSLRDGSVRWQGSDNAPAAYRVAVGHNTLFTAAQLDRADFLQRHTAPHEP